jgi:hypothetical protein
MQRKDLDLSKLEVVRDKYNHYVKFVNHGRAIYKDATHYYKVFHPEYVRLPYFRQALAANFFDGLVHPDIEYIYEDGEVVGYKLPIGEVLSDNEYDQQLVPTSFWRIVEKAMLRTGLVFYDFVPPNIIKIGGELSLIDLESIYPLEKLGEMPSHNAKLKPLILMEHLIERMGPPPKDIIFIPNIKLDNGRSGSYELAINSWKQWADANNADVLVMEDLVHPIEDMKITWQRYMLFEMLENSGVGFNRVLMADADMVIQPHTPNFFEMTEGKYVGVQANGCYEWLSRSIEGYRKLFWPDITVHPWEYINGGFQIVHKYHRTFFESVVKFYWDNQEMLLKAQNELVRASTDQTPINFLLKQHGVPVKLLPEAFNLQDPCRKTLLKTDDRQWWPDSLDNLRKACYIVHFNAIEDGNLKRDANYWIERFYNELS